MFKFFGYFVYLYCVEVCFGLLMNYFDEGLCDGEVVVMVYGNLLWSYYWCMLVVGLLDWYCCIVLDYIGMGLLDKFDDVYYDYMLQLWVDDLDVLFCYLGIIGLVILVVYDWGGMIGFGWVLLYYDQVKCLVVFNIVVFLMFVVKQMFWQIVLGWYWLIGEWIICIFNVFFVGVLWFGVEWKMLVDVCCVYVLLYNSYVNWISIICFMQDILLGLVDKVWLLFECVGKVLLLFVDCLVFIGWGLCDFVFDYYFLVGFQVVLLQVQVYVFEDVGYYLLEDKYEVLVLEICVFLDVNLL